MPGTNFANGLSVDGVPVLPRSSTVRTGAVRFVGNRSGLKAGIGRSSKSPYSTLAAACGDSAMIANSGQTIYVMEGHAETTATTVLTGLTAGTKIVGCGDGGAKPSFQLTATGAQLAISVANVTFENIKFKLEGANGVVKAIAVTGADCTFLNCEFEVASGAALKATIALEIGTGAHRARLIGCKFRGTATHNVTDCVKVAGAVDQVEIVDCNMVASATAANGLIHITGAATNILIARCMVYNTHTSSTASIKIDDVASTGFICNILSADENDGTATAQGVVFAGTSTTTIKCAECYAADQTAKNALLSPGVNT